MEIKTKVLNESANRKTLNIVDKQNKKFTT